MVVESLNANKSFKYFGSGPGSSLYSFIVELNRLFYTTSISSCEREAAYVADPKHRHMRIKYRIYFQIMVIKMATMISEIPLTLALFDEKE